MRQSLSSKCQNFTLGKCFALCGLFLIFAHCFGAPPNLPAYSKELAKIGDVSVKEDKLRGYLQLELSNFPKEWQKDAFKIPLFDSENLRPILLSTFDRLIQDELVLQYGAEKNFLLNEDELAIEFKKQKEKYSNKELEVMLKEKDLSLNFWKQHIERQIQINNILYNIDKNSVSVSQQEIRSFYNKNRNDYEVSEQVRIRHIVTDTQDKAKEVYARLKKGENFAKLALEHSQAPERSQGGDLGYFSKGQMPKVFDVCFSLEMGQLSDVIKSEYGFHIFKVLDKRAAHVLGLEEVANQIYQKLFAEKQKIQYQKWLEDRKQKVKIEVIEENLKTITL